MTGVDIIRTFLTARYGSYSNINHYSISHWLAIRSVGKWVQTATVNQGGSEQRWIGTLARFSESDSPDGNDYGLTAKNGRVSLRWGKEGKPVQIVLGLFLKRDKKFNVHINFLKIRGNISIKSLPIFRCVHASLSEHLSCVFF